MAGYLRELGARARAEARVPGERRDQASSDGFALEETREMALPAAPRSADRRPDAARAPQLQTPLPSMPAASLRSPLQTRELDVEIDAHSDGVRDVADAGAARITPAPAPVQPMRISVEAAEAAEAGATSPVSLPTEQAIARLQPLPRHALPPAPAPRAAIRQHAHDPDAVAAAMAAPSDVHVHIGRVELSAIVAKAPPRQGATPKKPLSLDDYLRQRGRRTP